MFVNLHIRCTGCNVGHQKWLKAQCQNSGKHLSISASDLRFVFTLSGPESLSKHSLSSCQIIDILSAPQTPLWPESRKNTLTEHFWWQTTRRRATKRLRDFHKKSIFGEIKSQRGCDCAPWLERWSLLQCQWLEMCPSVAGGSAVSISD